MEKIKETIYSSTKNNTSSLLYRCSILKNEELLTISFGDTNIRIQAGDIVAIKCVTKRQKTEMTLRLIESSKRKGLLSLLIASNTHSFKNIVENCLIEKIDSLDILHEYIKRGKTNFFSSQNVKIILLDSFQLILSTDSGDVSQKKTIQQTLECMREYCISTKSWCFFVYQEDRFNFKQKIITEILSTPKPWECISRKDTSGLPEFVFNSFNHIICTDGIHCDIGYNS